MRMATTLAAALFVSHMGLAGTASAAVRVCRAPVASAVASDAVEARARSKAIASWTDKAKAAGTSNASWRIAGKRVLRCARVATGKFDCVALAEPCTLSQVAPQVPKRGKVKDKPIST